MIIYPKAAPPAFDALPESLPPLHSRSRCKYKNRTTNKSFKRHARYVFDHLNKVKFR